MTQRRPREIIAYANEIRDHLRDNAVRLRDIRAKLADLEAFAGRSILQTSLYSEISRIAVYYYPLPAYLALYGKRWQAYLEHVRNGDLDWSDHRKSMLAHVYGICTWWLAPHLRYPYGDVRVLRPIIGRVLTDSTTWTHIPYPDHLAALGQWHEELAPGGALYPSAEQLAYVARFEAFAEHVVWDMRGREHLTIVNFPAPPNALPATAWWCTQHGAPRPSVRIHHNLQKGAD